MLSRFFFNPAPATNGSVVTCRLVPVTTLALAVTLALAAGCSDRPTAPEDAARSAPAARASDHETAGVGAHDGAAAAQDGHAAHSPAGAMSPTLPATRWASDAPLREGMRRMHRAVEALGHAEHDHLDAAQATAAAQQVLDAANYMITNCKLPPEPDAALHGVLSTLMTGAAAIQRDPANTTPVPAMRDAVALYPRMFVDATWQADTSPAD